MKEEIKIMLKEEYYKIILVIKYLCLHPFYELRNLINGYYNSTLLFWCTLIIFFYMWHNNVIGTSLRAMGFIVILVYIYGFTKDEKWKEYYEKEMVKGYR